ncbi:hypothetical protein IFM89_020380 [Coptis chinensis]|uniref:Uncharacterized protein n=1 Tax=Coptis chinensis TaxID=261450 RepID=A0A835LQW0_9MAGN|nr:hypothetical protein IFM89_020380 [Coptis chinensis]
MVHERVDSQAVETVGNKIYVFASDMECDPIPNPWDEVYDVHSGEWSPLPQPPDVLIQDECIIQENMTVFVNKLGDGDKWLMNNEPLNENEIANEYVLTIGAEETLLLVSRKTDPSYSRLLSRKAIGVCGSSDKYIGAYSDGLKSYVCPFYCSYYGYQVFLVQKVQSLHDNKGHANTFMCSLFPGASFSQVQYTPVLGWALSRFAEVLFVSAYWDDIGIPANSVVRLDIFGRLLTECVLFLQ